MNQQTVEQDLLKANKIEFHPSDDYTKEPPVVVLIFDDKLTAGYAYKNIMELFDPESELTLSIKKSSKNTLDVSIIQKDTADAVNRKNIPFNKYNFNFFLSKHSTDIHYTMFYGFIDKEAGELPVIASPFNPEKFFRMSKIHFLNK